MSMLDDLGELGKDALEEGLSSKLDDGSQSDEALKATTARISVAHIWPFLAQAVDADDYRARRSLRSNEVRSICASVSPEDPERLALYVLGCFDKDFQALREASVHQGESGDPELRSTLLPEAAPTTEDDSDDQVNVPEPVRGLKSHGPGLFENPRADQELEDPSTYYGLWGAGGQMNRAAADVTPFGRISVRPVASVGDFGRITLAARSWGRAPWDDDDDYDPDGTIAEEENRDPEADVYADYDLEDEDTYGDYRGGAKERSPRNEVPDTWSSQGHVSRASLKAAADHVYRALLAEEKGKKKEDDDEKHKGKEEDRKDDEEEGEDDKERRRSGHTPGKARPGNSKARPSAGRQVKHHRSGAVKEAYLAAPPGSFDPGDVFPGYWGPRTALLGNSAVPADPESGTGASGMFNSGVSDAGANFSQADLPPTVQDTTTGMPGLAHIVDALLRVSSDIRKANPGVGIKRAVEIAAEAVGRYPSMLVRRGSGGADWLPLGEEVIEPCPQCGRDGYNPDINVCHFCGFYDAGKAPVTTVRKV